MDDKMASSPGFHSSRAGFVDVVLFLRSLLLGVMLCSLHFAILNVWTYHFILHWALQVV